MCVNDVPEEEVGSKPILIQKLLVQESKLPGKQSEVLEGRF